MSKGFALVLVLVLAVSSVITFLPVKAQYQGDIIINPDGSVSPSPVPIQQVGNVYSLTSDMAGSIIVNGNNLLFDGDGHTLSGAVSLNHVSNVTVKNLIITGGEQFGSETQNGDIITGIYLDDASNVVVDNNTVTDLLSAGYFMQVLEYYDMLAGIIVSGGHSNVISGNNLVNNNQGMEFDNTQRNLIVGNNITFSEAVQKAQGSADPAGIYFNDASNNTIYHNNFEIGMGGQAGYSYGDSFNIWDDGFPFGGNFWGDYCTRYPNATEIDN